jgi:hypothetical protein
VQRREEGKKKDLVAINRHVEVHIHSLGLVVAAHLPVILSIPFRLPSLSLHRGQKRSCLHDASFSGCDRETGRDREIKFQASRLFGIHEPCVSVVFFRAICRSRPRGRSAFGMLHFDMLQKNSLGLALALVVLICTSGRPNRALICQLNCTHLLSR